MNSSTLVQTRAANSRVQTPVNNQIQAIAEPTQFVGPLDTLVLKKCGQQGQAQSMPIEAGDLWQGVYRFDSVDVRGGAGLDATDPIEGGAVTLWDVEGMDEDEMKALAEEPVEVEATYAAVRDAVHAALDGAAA